MRTVLARRYDTLEPVRIMIHGDRIANVEPAWPASSIEAWPLVAPGLFDLQINGHGGVWFGQPGLTGDDIHRVVTGLAAHGVTRCCPTLTTNGPDALLAGFTSLAKACAEDAELAARFPGYHLEGPYISANDGPRGAHPREHVRPCDWDEFERLQSAADGRIRLVTLAPEVDGAVDFIRRAVAAGVVIALGHTAATASQIAAAVDAGATLSTHLGNGCATQLHRHDNPLWAQLSDPRLTASVIADGHHLPAPLLRALLRSKAARGTVLTCDASGWAGCPPGVYRGPLGSSELLPNGKLVVAGQRELLAGSAQETDHCVAVAENWGSVSRRDAIEMASRTPARLLRFEPARLRRGGLAHLWVFRPAAPATDSVPQTAVTLATLVGERVVFGSVNNQPTLGG